MGVLIFSFVILFLILSNLQISFTTVAFWITIIIVVSLGILVGWLLTKYEWIVNIITSSTAGYLVAVFLYNAFFSKVSENPKLVFWIVVLLCILFMILLAYLMKNLLIIITTAFIGAFGIVRVSFLK